MKHILIVIPARSGSQRVPHKNIRSLTTDSKGRSLLSVTAITAACARNQLSDCSVDIVVSTDDPSYMDAVPADLGIHLVERPAELSGPESDIAEAIRHAVEDMETRRPKYDWVVTLQPAVPLRSGQLIANMLRDVARLHCLSAITGCRTVPWRWSWDKGKARNTWTPGPYPRSQSMERFHWQELNSVQIAAREVVMRGQRWDLPLLVQWLPPWAVLDIDTPEDFARAQLVLFPLLDLMHKDMDDGSLVVTDINDQRWMPSAVRA